ncbi:MAG TPA: STAS domain-containing protein [Anaerolineales bacterium]|nr:STAS domain-containing protein [Anaerolineales bacterium]
MNMTSEQTQARVPVTILRLSGDVDGSNYRAVIDQAQALYRQGTRDLLIDLGGVAYTSSAGLVALHNVALLFNALEPPDPEQGWRAIRAVADAGEGGPQPHVKLLNPQPRVAGVLEQTGLASFFQIYNDQAAALASF